MSIRIIVAPDSFKGSVSAVDVAEAISRGISTVFAEAEVLKVPIADGGEGTVEALVAATGGKNIAGAGDRASGRIHRCSLGSTGRWRDRGNRNGCCFRPSARTC